MPKGSRDARWGTGCQRGRQRGTTAEGNQQGPLLRHPLSPPASHGLLRHPLSPSAPHTPSGIRCTSPVAPPMSPQASRGLLRHPLSPLMPHAPSGIMCIPYPLQCPGPPPASSASPVPSSIPRPSFPSSHIPYPLRHPAASSDIPCLLWHPLSPPAYRNLPSPPRVSLVPFGIPRPPPASCNLPSPPHTSPIPSDILRPSLASCSLLWHPLSSPASRSPCPLHFAALQKLTSPPASHAPSDSPCLSALLWLDRLRVDSLPHLLCSCSHLPLWPSVTCSHLPLAAICPSW